MLTKDLLRVTHRNKRIFPRFVSTEDNHLLSLAKQMIEIFKSSQTFAFYRIESQIETLYPLHKDIKLVKGLYKLLIDRSQFSHLGHEDFPLFRKKVFQISKEVLKNSDESDLNIYRKKIETQFPGKDPASLLYGDLPENMVLCEFKDIYPKDLLFCYNSSLIQFLLLYARSINIRIKEVEFSRLRNFFKYLKFFRLMGRIKTYQGSSGLLKSKKPQKEGNEYGFKGKKNSYQMEIEIDGPLNLFEGTQKYGIQLAGFIPAVWDLSGWELETELKIRKKSYLLKLDQATPVRKTYQHFSMYVPEELDFFKKEFNSGTYDTKFWILNCESGFLDLGNQEIIFPDMTFAKNGISVHLELFHRWHYGVLEKRIRYLNQHPQCPLIIGIDHFLFRKRCFQKELKQTESLKRCFVFRDIPSVSSVIEALESYSNPN